MTLEAYRARAGSLLAFAAVRAAPSRRTPTRSDVTAPVRETHERLLRGTLDVLGFNQRILSRLRTLLSVGLLCLATGTILIGARVTELLL